MAEVNNNQMNINAMYGNQAGLAFIDQTTISLNALQRFGLSELGNYSLVAALPLDVGSFGVGLDYFGFEGYNERKIALAYSRKLLENLSIGAQFNFFQLTIPEYGNQNALNFEIGLISKILDNLYLGAHLVNPVRADKVSGVEEFPLVFNLGLLYRPTDKLQLHLEFEKDLDKEENFKIGLDYQVAKILYLRLGAGTGPSNFSFGLGIDILDQLRFDFGSAYHNVLGFSPAGGLVYQFK